MAFSVVRMGKKLGLVGTPRISAAAAAAAAKIRTVLCQKNRHLATNAKGLSEVGETQGLLDEKTDTIDKTRLYKGNAALLFAAVLAAYIEYEKKDREARNDAAFKQFLEAHLGRQSS